ELARHGGSALVLLRHRAAGRSGRIGAGFDLRHRTARRVLRVLARARRCVQAAGAVALGRLRGADGVLRAVRRAGVRAAPTADAGAPGGCGMSGGTKFQQSLLEPRASRAVQYRDLVLGTQAGWGMLAYYEIVVALAGSLPGALGLALRGALYRPLFKGFGRAVVLGRGLVLRHPARITIADGVLIDDHCVLDARGSGAG